MAVTHRGTAARRGSPGYGVIRQRHEIDLAARFGYGKTRHERGDEGRCRYALAEVARPDLVERRHVVDIREVNLRLDHARERRARALEGGDELIAHNVIGLELYAIAFPNMPFGHLRFGGDASQITRFPGR